MNKENMTVEGKLDAVFALNNAMYGKLHSKREKQKDLKHRISLLIHSQRAAAVAEFKAETVNVIMSGEENPLMAEVRKVLMAELMPLVRAAVARHRFKPGFDLLGLEVPLDEAVEALPESIIKEAMEG